MKPVTQLRDFQAVLFDMDGTLYRVNKPLPGVDALLRHLRGGGVQVACLTNNSANTEQELAARLSTMGIEMAAADIHTAAHAMAEHILAHWPRPRVFNFSGDALPLALADVATLVHEVEQPCDVVAVGTHGRYYGNGPGFDQEKAAVAMQLLRRGAHLVVGCNDRVFPTPGGLEIGSGSWGAMFSYAADLPSQRVYYAGKPQRLFFERLCKRLQVEPARCLLVGDNLESDIGGGLGAGMQTALVLTGVTQREHLAEATVKPTYVFDDLAQMLTKMS